MISPEMFLIESIGILLSMTFVTLAIWANFRNLSRIVEMFMKKRHPASVYILNIALLFAIITFQCSISIQLHSSSPLVLLPLTIHFVSIWCFFCVILTRSFILYFKINWSKVTLECDTQKWHHLLNPSAAAAANGGDVTGEIMQSQTKSNWFITNHHRFGRTKKMYPIFGSLCSIACILCIVSSVLVFLEMGNDSILFIVTLSTVVPVILIYCILVYKCPSFDDQFQILWEQRVHSKLLLLMAIAWILIGGFRQLFPDSVLYIAFTPICSALWFAILWVSSYVIYTKNKREAILRREQQKRRRRTVSEISRSTSNAGGPAVVTVETILSNEAAIHLFVQHLMKEYSVEVLLSYIEFSQFQEYLSDAMPLATILKIKQLVLPPSIPTSEIVTKNDSAKQKAHQLYLKYVALESEYEINIASSERARLIEILGNEELLLSEENRLTKEELFFLFEPCKKAMIQLLQYSLSRMKHSPQFGRVVEALDDSNKSGTF